MIKSMKRIRIALLSFLIVLVIALMLSLLLLKSIVYSNIVILHDECRRAIYVEAKGFENASKIIECRFTLNSIDRLPLNISVPIKYYFKVYLWVSDNLWSYLKNRCPNVTRGWIIRIINNTQVIEAIEAYNPVIRFEIRIGNETLCCGMYIEQAIFRPGHRSESSAWDYLIHPKRGFGCAVGACPRGDIYTSSRILLEKMKKVSPSEVIDIINEQVWKGYRVLKIRYLIDMLWEGILLRKLLDCDLDMDYIRNNIRGNFSVSINTSITVSIPEPLVPISSVYWVLLSLLGVVPLSFVVDKIFMKR